MRINHVAIVVRDLEEAITTYSQKLGFSLESRQRIDAEGIEIAIMSLENAHIELLMPIQENTGVAKFLEKRGEGLHHVCFEVDNIETLINSLQTSGIKLIDKTPRMGYRGNKAIFVHPSSTNGVLIEFYEK
ncbi:MAG: methylmalonyl-CoA epimerase [bacterium]